MHPLRRQGRTRRATSRSGSGEPSGAERWIRTSARRPVNLIVDTELPNHGPATRCQLSGCPGTCAARPSNARIVRSAAALQPSRNATFIAHGTWLRSGEQVTWYTGAGVTAPKSTCAT